MGRKRYYMTSVTLFTLASFLCGIAPNLTVLILARATQGAAGGVATVILMPIVGFVSGRIDARLLIGTGFLIQAIARLYMSHLSTDMTFTNAAVARMLQSIGLPFLFIPITTVAYVGLASNESNRVSAMMNVARHLVGTDLACPT
jgi:DHA2 family multidrug resistance protein